MRQAINNLQSTHSGFGFVSGDNVFKVCDQPHPIIVQSIIRACLKSDIDGAMEKLNELWDQKFRNWREREGIMKHMPDFISTGVVQEEVLVQLFAKGLEDSTAAVREAAIALVSCEILTGPI